MAKIVPSQARGDVPKTIHVESGFSDGGAIAVRYTRDGEDTRRPVAWRGIPGDTVEIALACEDPDVPDETFLQLAGGRDRLGQPRARGGGLPGGRPAGVNDFGHLGYSI